MKSSILFVTMVSFASAATATCVCSTGTPMYKYPGGAALVFAIRYETGDCDRTLPGQCQFPTNVYDYRTRGNWETPEHCPFCRPYGTSPMKHTAMPSQPSQTEPAPDASHPNQTDGEQPEGISIDTSFDPIQAGVLPDGSQATELGLFRLRTKNKIVADIDSDASIKLDRDIDAKVFRVRYPNVSEEQIVAFEVRQPIEFPKVIEGEHISHIQFERHVGDRILTLKVSHKDHPQFKGKTVYLFRAKQETTK